MPSIIFEQFGGTTTDLPTATGAGAIGLFGFGYEQTLAELGGAGFAILPLIQTLGEAPEIEPTVSIGDAIISVTAAYSFGPNILPPATGDGVIYLFGYGYEAEDFGYGVVLMRGFGEGFGVYPPPVLVDDIVMLEDTLLLSMAPESNITYAMHDFLRLAMAPDSRLEGSSTLTAGLLFSVNTHLFFQELLENVFGLELTLTDDYLMMERMQSALLLSGVVSGAIEAQEALLDALVFADVHSTFLYSAMADALGLSEAVTQSFTAHLAMLDALELAAAMTPHVTMSVLISDALALSITQASDLEAHSVLRDNMEFVLQVSVDDEQYVAWTMNTVNKASSKFTNYPFNSFMKLGDRYFGANASGLYQLGGDSDNEEDIAARLRIGMSALGVMAKKRLPDMYIGYTASGDMLLKVILAPTNDGLREAHTYRLINKNASSIRESRRKVGGGLSAIYFDFELENIDGADFSIDTIEFTPLVLSRKLRGNAGSA